MEPIERSYSTRIYEWPVCDRPKFNSIINWVSKTDQPTVVYHPHLAFDALSNDVRVEQIIDRRVDLFESHEVEHAGNYLPKITQEVPIDHEAYRVKGNFFDEINPILDAIARENGYPNAQKFWYNTGFWTAVSGTTKFEGMSLTGLRKLYVRTDRLDSHFVLSTAETILCFTIRNKSLLEFELDAYHNNRFSVFADSIRSIRSSLSEVSEWKCLLRERETQDAIFALNKYNGNGKGKARFRSISVQPRSVIPAFGNSKERSKNYYFVVLENKQIIAGNHILPAEDLAIVSTREGLWSETNSDFSKKKKFSLFICWVRRLRTCLLAELMLDRIVDHDLGSRDGSRLAELSEVLGGFESELVH